MYPANTKQHLQNICTASALRHWSNISQMLYKCFVFAAVPFVAETLTSSSTGARLLKIPGDTVRLPASPLPEELSVSLTVTASSAE